MLKNLARVLNLFGFYLLSHREAAAIRAAAASYSPRDMWRRDRGRGGRFIYRGCNCGQHPSDAAKKIMRIVDAKKA